MKFEICHTSIYNYSNPVFFEPHYLRLEPKITVFSTLLEFSIDVEPKPKGFSNQIDVENNHICMYWFENLHSSLKITAKSIINVSKHNPFNFLIHPNTYLQIPFTYDDKTRQLIKPAIESKNLTQEMKDFLTELIQEANHKTIPFLVELTKKIHQNFTLEFREKGEPFLPSTTFKRRKGSCRDLSWMQIHLLRYLGIGARFVSGYYYLNDEQLEFELHAWVEVFLPGAGWVGFDPSHGMITDIHHIPLACSSFHQRTMPVSGSIRGDASSNLKHDLKIRISS